MGFVIGEIPEVRRVVKFELPADEGKPAKRADFVAVLKVRDVETMRSRRKALENFRTQYDREMAKARRDPEYDPNIPETDFDEEFLREDLVSLEGIMDSEGNELEYSETLLSDVLLNRYARAALIKTWADLNLTDTGSAKRKNS